MKAPTAAVQIHLSKGREFESYLKPEPELIYNAGTKVR